MEPFKRDAIKQAVLERACGIAMHWKEEELERRRADSEFERRLTPDDHNFLWVP